MAHAEIVGNKIILTIPVEKITVGLKENMEEILNNYPIDVIPTRKLSASQNALIHVLLKQYGDVLGWTMQDMKEYIKEQFALAYDLFEFSTSKCDMQLANEFIAFMIEHAIENDINLYIMNKQDRKSKHILEIDEVTNRYVIACLKSKKCVICNSDADLEHWDNVNQIGGYKYDDGLKGRFISLCRKHHNEKHNTSREEFEKKYHIKGIYLNEKLVIELKEIYPSHFKAFKEGKNEL